MKKTIIIMTFSLIFAVLSTTVLSHKVEAKAKVDRKPESCDEGYTFVSYGGDGLCCKDPSTFLQGTVDYDKKCQVAIGKSVKTSPTSSIGTTKECYYKVEKDDYGGNIEQIGNPGIACNKSSVTFTLSGKEPVCSSDQCEYTNLGTIMCVNNKDNRNLTSQYCCIGADSSVCPDTPWCTGGCPISSDGDGGGDGSSEVPTLTCEEICSGEEKGSDNYNYCISCICAGEPTGTTTTGNVWTELGCIDATQNGIIISVMRIFVGVVTGLAIIRFVQAGFMLNTDDPEKIKEGKSIAVSAVTAIVFGALLIVILNFIGINVLGIGRIIA